MKSSMPKSATASEFRLLAKQAIKPNCTCEEYVRHKWHKGKHIPGCALAED